MQQTTENAAPLRLFRGQGIDSAALLVSVIGSNYLSLTNVAAAIGLAQLDASILHTGKTQANCRRIR